MMKLVLTLPKNRFVTHNPPAWRAKDVVGNDYLWDRTGPFAIRLRGHAWDKEQVFSKCKNTRGIYPGSGRYERKTLLLLCG